MMYGSELGVCVNSVDNKKERVDQSWDKGAGINC